MADTVWVVAAFVTFVAIMVAWDKLDGRRRVARKSKPWPRAVAKRASSHPSDLAADQLKAVMTARFEPRPIMSRAEASVFQAAEHALKRLDINGRVMAQVCLGEVLRTPDEAAFRAINSKRVDILLISNAGLPLAAIEYQGQGHYQGTAHARDAIKKAALHRAGIAYIEATPQHTAEDIERDIARALQARAAQTGSKAA